MAVDVSKHVAKADAAAAQKKYDLAMEIYLQALQIDPDNRDARRGVRLAALRRVEHNYPSSMAIRLQTAAARVGMMHPSAERKMASCEAYLKVDPKNTDVALTLAEAAEKAGHANAAVGVYEAMVEYAPKEVRAYVGLGRLLAGKEPDKAIAALERALQLDPRNQEAMKLRKDLAAEISIKKTGFETARTTHDLLRDKDKSKQLADTDRMHRSADESTDLITRLRRQIAAAPEDRRLLRQFAKALAASNQYDEAEATWNRLIEHDAGDFDAKVQLGDLRIGRVERALAKARQEGRGANVESLERKLTEVQIEEFSLRVAEHPTDLALRFELGEVLLRAGRLDEAIGEFQRAVKDPRKRVDSLAHLGECFLQKGLYDLAARQLERALEESPGLNSERGKTVVYNLGLLRERQGDLAAAKEQYLKVYEIDVAFRDVAQKVTALSKPS